MRGASLQCNSHSMRCLIIFLRCCGVRVCVCSAGVGQLATMADLSPTVFQEMSQEETPKAAQPAAADAAPTEVTVEKRPLTGSPRDFKKFCGLGNLQHVELDMVDVDVAVEVDAPKPIG